MNGKFVVLSFIVGCRERLRVVVFLYLFRSVQSEAAGKVHSIISGWPICHESTASIIATSWHITYPRSRDFSISLYSERRRGASKKFPDWFYVLLTAISQNTFQDLIRPRSCVFSVKKYFMQSLCHFTGSHRP
jgi:hypothetical protein